MTAEQLADGDPVDPGGGSESAKGSNAGFDIGLSKDKKRMRAARGISLAVLVAAAFWLLIAVLLYLLL